MHRAMPVSRAGPCLAGGHRANPLPVIASCLIPMDAAAGPIVPKGEVTRCCDLWWATFGAAPPGGGRRITRQSILASWGGAHIPLYFDAHRGRRERRARRRQTACSTL